MHLLPYKQNIKHNYSVNFTEHLTQSNYKLIFYYFSWIIITHDTTENNISTKLFRLTIIKVIRNVSLPLFTFNNKLFMGFHLMHSFYTKQRKFIITAVSHQSDTTSRIHVVGSSTFQQVPDIVQQLIVCQLTCLFNFHISEYLETDVTVQSFHQFRTAKSPYISRTSEPFSILA